MKIKRSLLIAAFTLVGINITTQVTAQSGYTLDFAIANFIKNADVFKSTDYGWTFVKSKSSPYRYFYRLSGSSSFVELFDPNGYLESTGIGVDGFNANSYKGVKYGSGIIPGSDGFVTTRNLFTNPGTTSIIKVIFSTNSIFKIESATSPLVLITSLIEFDNDIYFRGRSTNLYTAFYKLLNNGWVITSGGDFFKDYEVGTQYIFDEKNERLVLSTGNTFVKDGIWSYKNTVYSELDFTNNLNEFDLEKFVGFIYNGPSDKGTPVMLGTYQKNDILGQELYRLDGNEINLITNASLNSQWTDVYNTTFNDHFDLFLEANIIDSIKPNNAYTSKKGRGIYKLNTTTNRLERLVHPIDNIYSVSFAVRNKDGIYLAAKKSVNDTKYGIYLYKNDNPILQKIDLKGEFLDYKSGLFVLGDEIYFASDKGYCKIVNSTFEDFYESSKNEIVLVENNKIYTNVSFDNSFRILSRGSVGINSIPVKDQINVYPNPLNDVIMINVNNNMVGSTYVISNALGKQVLTGKLTDEASTIDMNTLSSGIYILRIGETEQQTFKLIKR